MATTVTPRVCPLLHRSMAGSLRIAGSRDPIQSREIVTIAAAAADVDAADGGVPEGTFPAPPGPAVGEMPPRALGSEPCPESAFQRRALLHSCRCRDRCHGQCWCRRQRRRDRACLRLRATWRANLCRRCWAVQLWSRAGWKSQRQRWRRCRRWWAGRGLLRRPAVRQGLRLCGPVRSQWVRNLHATEGGGGTILLASSVPPGAPAPPPVLPVPPPAPESEGGGGTTLGVPSVGAEEDASERVPVPPDTPVRGRWSDHVRAQRCAHAVASAARTASSRARADAWRRRDDIGGERGSSAANRAVRMNRRRRWHDFGGAKDLAHQAAHERSAARLRGRRRHDRLRRIRNAAAGQAVHVLRYVGRRRRRDDRGRRQTQLGIARGGALRSRDWRRHDRRISFARANWKLPGSLRRARAELRWRPVPEWSAPDREPRSAPAQPPTQSATAHSARGRERRSEREESPPEPAPEQPERGRCETLGAGGISVALRVGAVIGRSRDTDGAGAITDSS